MKIISFFFIFFCAINIKAAERVEPERIRQIYNAILTAPPAYLRQIEANYNISTDLYQILSIKKPFFCFGHPNDTVNFEMEAALEEVINNFTLMNTLADAGDIEANVRFINLLSPDDIDRIYRIREIYNPFAQILNFEPAPSLTASGLNGIYRGKSSLLIAFSEEERQFQKAFYSIEKDDVTYFVGHNISHFSRRLSSDGCFRVYENSYPVYDNGRDPLLLPLQPGTLSLSYEKQDLEPVEGLSYADGFPVLTNYDHIYYGNKKCLAGGSFIFENLKDQIFEITRGENENSKVGFWTSLAFRGPKGWLPSALVETKFVMTYQCDLKDIQNCPLAP